MTFLLWKFMSICQSVEWWIDILIHKTSSYTTHILRCLTNVSNQWFNVICNVCLSSSCLPSPIVSWWGERWGRGGVGVGVVHLSVSFSAWYHDCHTISVVYIWFVTAVFATTVSNECYGKLVGTAAAHRFVDQLSFAVITPQSDTFIFDSGLVVPKWLDHTGTDFWWKENKKKQENLPLGTLVSDVKSCQLFTKYKSYPSHLHEIQTTYWLDGNLPFSY